MPAYPQHRTAVAYVRPPSLGLGVSVFIARLVVGGVLIYAGLSKALAPASDFAAAIQTYHLIPGTWATPLAKGLPWIELYVGLALFTGYWTRLSAAGALALFGVFLSALGSALARHLDLTSCGCFGGDSLSPHVTIWMDGGLTVLALYVLIATQSPALFSLDAWIVKPLTARRR